MRSYGPRLDPDGVVPHAPVADALTYDRPLPLYTRTVGTGQILCELVRATKPGRRLVRLTATFLEAGVDVTAVCMCTSELDEQRSLERLERRMREAQIRPLLLPSDVARS